MLSRVIEKWGKLYCYLQFSGCKCIALDFAVERGVAPPHPRFGLLKGNGLQPENKLSDSRIRPTARVSGCIFIVHKKSQAAN
ncbi:hypothetical protein QDY72_07770 [Kingella negevensis]|uniref:hypothetical protein n=1 Tax=Kingella negevensis TaxID=1522312 RepID=UPI000BA3FA0D|nr:hypothetical protein [Kingella negevensis]MDK4681189.1 hypothetical protein [Kingella negevensis]MDK4683387.1 hypothetical protein [Kingella negevensis]MDK4685070.1 hypothetical protein [Kingella negevensis]MDK4691479.1 hypothetical protein [Kingella negevensis]MDK4706832.1 hypothetical protein [Kingella negevensis]